MPSTHRGFPDPRSRRTRRPPILQNVRIEVVSFDFEEAEKRVFDLGCGDEVLPQLGAKDHVIQEVRERMSLLHADQLSAKCFMVNRKALRA